MRDSLSSFLPTLPGIIDTPAHLNNSSLRSVIEKPPVLKEFAQLNTHQLAPFHLHPGPTRAISNYESTTWTAQT